jgi:hypothetical protein
MRCLALVVLVSTLAGSLTLAAAQVAPAGPRPLVSRGLVPRFAASEGATGTENPLAYDELIPLGSATVGQGPNTGTYLRVTNQGRFAMTLGVPLLGGTHPDDFAVEVENTPLALLVASDPAAVAAPFRRLRTAGGPGLALEVDSAALASLAGLREVELLGFPLASHGAVTLVLRRRELPIAEDAKLVVDGREVPGGMHALTRDLQVWSGSVEGLTGSRVFLTFDGSSVGGFLELPDALERRILVLSDGPGRVRLVAEAELRALGLGEPTELCAGQLPVRGRTPVLPTVPTQPGALARVPTVLSECRLAIETDWQLFQTLTSTALLTTYVTGFVAAASEQFLTDAQVTLAIAYLGVHTNANDGWDSQENGGGTYELLEEHRAAWGTNWPAEADLAHFLSGADLGGGIAYLDVLCHDEYGFGVSANLRGDIDWPSWTGAPGDFWDFLVFAHELGHNFGSYHTHDYCPPFDECASNCNGVTNCTRGTIMGYCHGCAGGVANVDLHFHPATADIMRHSIEASCLSDARLAPGDFVEYLVRFNPLFTPGAKSANLEFGHDAPNAPQPFRVRLSGTGL